MIKYQSLVSGDDLSDSIEAAFGFDGYVHKTDAMESLHAIYKLYLHVACKVGVVSSKWCSWCCRYQTKISAFRKKVCSIHNVI